MSRTLTHPILLIPELIHEILNHVWEFNGELYYSLDSPLDFYKNIDAAGSVCKLFRQVALAIKWREVEWRDLLSILGPLKKVDGLWVRAQLHPPYLGGDNFLTRCHIHRTLCGLRPHLTGIDLIRSRGGSMRSA